MYNTIGIKSDYSILKSLIKIPDLVSFCIENNIKTIGLIDDNLFGSIELYDLCLKNNIKPLIGLEIEIDKKHFYLYAKNYDGYKSLLKVNTLVQKKELTSESLKNYNKDVIMVIPFNVKDYYVTYKDIFDDIFISYQNDYEKKNASVLCKNVVCIKECNSLKDNEESIKILDSIRNDNTKVELNVIEKLTEEDLKVNEKFIELINIQIEKNKRHIPVFENKINDSFKYLYALCHKGLEKRFNNKVEKEYIERLNYELDVIKKMGFVDYFLIVYDYVKYAKNNNIFVGPGRGSAAGSLVSYSIGITNVDPIKYNLLFERFLNPERITMPDIDIDFEDQKRDQVIEYVKEKYGKDYVAPVLTFGTLGARQVLKDVAKYYNLDNKVDVLTKVIDQRLSLKDNFNNEKVKQILELYPDLKDVYIKSYYLEGLKRQISTTAAGVVICDTKLDEIIPICYSDSNMLAGMTLNYLEELGIIKMDFLGITNLTIIHKVLDSIDNEVNLNKIDLEDKEVYDLFSNADTDGIFQFESDGMKNFLKKLKPQTFSDLYAALALFRPGPMEYIDEFIARKEGRAKIDYIDDSLKDILSETYGIIIYQEQIMLILRKMGNFSFAEADNIRRAMSKKKEEIIVKEKDHFIKSAISNGYSENVATKTYEKILKFAGYGFNKAHSVSYALIGYQMAYLKRYYKEYFITTLLNMNIGSVDKTNEYLKLARQSNIHLLKPSVNLSNKQYTVEDKKLRLPLSVIKNVGNIAEDEILDIRSKNDNKFIDYFDFMAKCYSKSINKKVVEYLIYAGALDEFNISHQMMINNLDNAIRYCELLSNLDESLVEKPLLEEYEEYSKDELIKQEYDAYGFYVNNHPASKYNDKSIVKLINIEQFFNKFVKCIVIIDNVKVIKTKKGDNMALIKASDETNTLDFVLFSDGYNMLKNVNKGDLVEIMGRVTKRFSDLQVTINKMTKK